MSIESSFGNFFKTESKASGERLIAEEKASIASGSDTTILAYVRATPPIRVMLASVGVGADSFTARCSCPNATKGQFCKHVWATLILTAEKFPDFLSQKKTLDLDDSPPAPKRADTFREEAKARAATYRKEAYESQKARVKERRQERKQQDAASDLSHLPAEIREGLAYFEKNGFPMPKGPSEEVLFEARRTLSRIFHPDRGGTHAEMVELNDRCEALSRYLGL